MRFVLLRFGLFDIFVVVHVLDAGDRFLSYTEGVVVQDVDHVQHAGVGSLYALDVGGCAHHVRVRVRGHDHGLLVGADRLEHVDDDLGFYFVGKLDGIEDDDLVFRSLAG